MTTQYIMTEEDRAKFERGAEKLKYMQRGQAFDDFWVPIGEGLLAVRRTVMHALRLTKARVGRNPNQPGSSFVIPPRATVKFKSGKIMRQKVAKLSAELKRQQLKEG